MNSSPTPREPTWTEVFEGRERLCWYTDSEREPSCDYCTAGLCIQKVELCSDGEDVVALIIHKYRQGMS